MLKESNWTQNSNIIEYFTTKAKFIELSKCMRKNIPPISLMEEVQEKGVG